MRSLYIVGVLLLTIIFAANAQMTKPFEEHDLKINWKLITNEYQNQSKFLAAFELIFLLPAGPSILIPVSKYPLPIFNRVYILHMLMAIYIK
jgi:hypothetical protein